MSVQDDSPDPGVRIHLAAHDPEFPAKRDAALALLRDAVRAVMARHGFTEKPQSWVREGPQGRAAIAVFPSRYGFEAEIRLSFLATDGEAQGVWAEEGHLTLDAFGAPAALIYLDVLDQPEVLAATLQVLEVRALPWLIGHLDASGGPILLPATPDPEAP
jgi:hypothetical protein